jgi:hypothetical protein
MNMRLVNALAAAGLMLAVAGCSGHLLPLGTASSPEPGPVRAAAPVMLRAPIVLLRAPIVLQDMSVQPRLATGGCPAGWATVPDPGRPGPSPCYRKLGSPVTFTAASVAVSQPPHVLGKPAPAVGSFQVIVALPAFDQPLLTAITTRAADVRAAVDISVAGKTWGVPIAAAPATQGQFSIILPTQKLALQLQRILVPSGTP